MPKNDRYKFIIPYATTFTILASIFNTQNALTQPKHAIAMHGQPKLNSNFQHMPYANPNAKKGGKIKYAVNGTFDSLNPFILKSMRTTARGAWDTVFGNLVFESMLKRTRNEPFTLYGLIAEKVEMPENRKWIEFHINKNAKFHDNTPITPQDAMFTFNLLKDKGRPPYSSRMKLVEKMEITGEHKIKITFNEKANRETPLLFGMMPILPQHATDKNNFEQSTLVPPMGSGPYKISMVKPGEKITFQKNKNYWGINEPINIGFFNFDTIEIEYFANANAQFEAFKKGLYDINPEGSAAKWETAYKFNAIENGEIVKETFERKTPSGMLGFVFNTRQEKFKNKNVRKALAQVFDFEWANENLFHGAFVRTSSYWQESFLSALDNPANEWEIKFFEKYPNLVPENIMDGTYRAPISDGSGRDRTILRQVISQLEKEGYRLKDGKMIGEDGKQMKFEILVGGGNSGQDMERLVLAYKEGLGKLGIILETRFVDDSQFQLRAGNFEYDMIVTRYSSSLSPGAEQKFRWGSVSQNMNGSFNFAGVNEPAVDELIEEMLKAKNDVEFTQAVRAFDRVLIAGHYLVPLYHSKVTRIAHTARMKKPEITPLYGPRFSTWWAQE